MTNPSTVPQLLDSLLGEIGDREAYVDSARRITFGQWAAASKGVAELFREKGAGVGSVVCLLLPSGIDYAVCYMAAMRSGAITSGLNPRLGPVEIAGILDRSRPAVLVTPDGTLGGRDLPLPQGCSILSVTEVAARWVAISQSDDARVPADHPVAVVWTSGTTGAPKGAVYSHANLRAVAGATGDLSAFGDRRLSPLPFCHVGYMTRPWDEISRGITTVVTPTPWKAADALSLIESERITVAQGVPAQWRLMLAEARAGSTDFSSLRVAGTGAAAVPPELIRTLRTRLGCPVVVGYASTETAVIAKSRVGDRDEDVAMTVGRAADGVELEVVDPEGRMLAPGVTGAVRVRSAATMQRYWGDPELTAQTRSPDGWISTGDLGRLDGRGYLTLAGRSSEMYIRGGYNVYPVEVEGVLCEHPGVAVAAVVGAPDPVLGEIGVAFVVPEARSHWEPSEACEELRGWCRERLADYKAPDAFEIVRELPLTAMSKVDKAALARRFREPLKRPVGPFGAEASETLRVVTGLGRP